MMSISRQLSTKESARKPDRRVKRTNRQLRDALLALIMEQGYEAITVQDITDRADLSRATFYLHYRDKDDLLVNSLEEMFDALVEAQGTLNPHMILSDSTPPSLIAFRHAQEYSRLYRVMLSERGVAYVMHRIQHYLAAVAQEQIALLIPAGSALPVPLEIVAHHVAGSLFGLIVWWLAHDMPHSAEYMAQTFHRLTIAGIVAALGLELPSAES